jgi:hypothetical protein
MFSKSLFNRNVNMERSVLNPVGVANSQFILTASTIEAVKAVQEFYTMNLADRKYDKIPQDYQKFLHLFNTVTTSYNKVSNKDIKTLLKVTQEGLQGAMNAYGLNVTVTDLTFKNTLLQNTINDMISGKNVKSAFSSSAGQFTIKKSFTLAPLFSYYIMLYGMPEPGAGFDQHKLSVLLEVLERNFINPYK